MKSVLDELPVGPAVNEEVATAIDRFIAERGFYMPTLDDDQLAAAAADLLRRLSEWARAEPQGAGHPTERLMRTWLRRRLPDLSAACERCRLFVRHHRPSQPSWNLSHFIATWFVTDRHPVASEVVLIFEVIVSKTLDDQEQGIREAVKTVVRRIRDLEKAAAALKTEIETRCGPEGRPFWPGVVDGFAASIRATVGEEAARATAAHMEGAFPALAGPFLALACLRPGWERLIAAVDHLGAGTIDAMQENFSSGTLGAAHAPEKRGLRFRIGLLSRAGFSPRETAEFEGEGVTAEAVAEHLRRRRASSGSG
jgi:hypothetical protein